MLLASLAAIPDSVDLARFEILLPQSSVLTKVPVVIGPMPGPGVAAAVFLAAADPLCVNGAGEHLRQRIYGLHLVSQTEQDEARSLRTRFRLDTTHGVIADHAQKGRRPTSPIHSYPIYALEVVHPLRHHSTPVKSPLLIA